VLLDPPDQLLAPHEVTLVHLPSPHEADARTRAWTRARSARWDAVRAAARGCARRRCGRARAIGSEGRRGSTHHAHRRHDEFDGAALLLARSETAPDDCAKEQSAAREPMLLREARPGGWGRPWSPGATDLGPARFGRKHTVSAFPSSQRALTSANLALLMTARE
jgi:hypothetical protein